MRKLLYTTREARDAIGCGNTRLYELINSGALEARRLGRRTYITGPSLLAFVDGLAKLTTPTMAKAAHDRWAGHRKPRPKTQEEDGPDAA